MCMERVKQYKVRVSTAALRDIRQTKEYIRMRFKYQSYVENYSKGIKKAVLGLEIFPEGHEQTGFEVEDNSIYYKPYKNYLIFYVIENSGVYILRIINNRMNWKEILENLNDESGI